MNMHNLLARYDKYLRVHVSYPEARKEVTGDVIRFVRNAPGMNFVGFTFANEPELDRVIDQQVEYFAPMQQPFTWKVYDHDLLPSLAHKLQDRNFVSDGGDSVMVIDLQNAAPDLFQPAPIDIRRITTREGLKDVVTVLDGVYGGHNVWVYERLGAHLQVPDYLSVYVAYIEDQPVSIAWTYFPTGQFATLFAGSTLANHRKRGLYSNLLATRLREIRARGLQYAIVEAGAMSKPILVKHGFQHLTTVYDFEWQGNRS